MRNEPLTQSVKKPEPQPYEPGDETHDQQPQQPTPPKKEPPLQSRKKHARAYTRGTPLPGLEDDDEQQQPVIQLPAADDGSAVLQAEPEPEPPQLIKGILHQGLKAELAGASKSMKSWMLLNIGVCVATGTPWLGQFDTTKARVIYLNLEVPKWHFHHRLRLVAEALQVQLEAGMFTVWNLRGTDLSRDDHWLAAQKRIIQAGQFGLILVDPLYKLFSEHRDESGSPGAIAIMKRFDILAEKTGAAPFFSHHFAKGSAAGKEAIDRFSGSGVLIRDPDVYLCMTRHEEEDAFTIEPTLRCLAPVEPFVIRWEHPLFKLAPALNPQEIRKPASADKTKFFPIDLAMQLGNDDLTTTELKKRCMEERGMSKSTFYSLLEKAEKKGLIHKDKVIGDRWVRVKRQAGYGRDDNNV